MKSCATGRPDPLRRAHSEPRERSFWRLICAFIALNSGQGETIKQAEGRKEVERARPFSGIIIRLGKQIVCVRSRSGMWRKHKLIVNAEIAGSYGC